MKITKAKGRLRGKQPKLKPNQATQLLELHDSGSSAQIELAELFSVGRSTVYWTIEWMRPKPPEPLRPFAHFAHPQGVKQRSAAGPAGSCRLGMRSHPTTVARPCLAVCATLIKNQGMPDNRRAKQRIWRGSVGRSGGTRP